jgi:sulfatase maturation enzyme AslB (radical SAM superfamily)
MAETYTCSYIGRELAFFTDSITPCCVSGGTNDAPRFPFHGGDFPVQEYRDWCSRLNEANQLPDGPCRKCSLLKLADSCEIPSRFGVLTFNHFLQCNARCSYCCVEAWSPENHRKISEQYEVSKAVKQLYDAGLLEENTVVNWGGGEPSLLKEFSDLSLFLASKGYFQIINTNAIKYSEAMGELLENADIMLRLSLDSGTPETYRTFKGTDSFEKIVENLRRYASIPNAPLKISMKYIMTNQNNSDEDIEGFFGICRDFGLKCIVLGAEFKEISSKATSQKTLEQMAKFAAYCRRENLYLVTYEEVLGSEYSKMLNCLIEEDKAKEELNKPLPPPIRVDGPWQKIFKYAKNPVDLSRRILKKTRNHLASLRP